MNPSEIAALAMALAALGATLAQWVRLFGPRRHGGHAVIHYLEQRIAETDAALAECLEQRRPPHRTQPGRWRTFAPRPYPERRFNHDR